MSALLAPGGTIGQTFASGSITKSISTGPGVARARSIAGRISASERTVMPVMP
jgi:hypothetical protein